MTESASATAAFRAARDLLLRYREDYEGARREFTWPELGEFNWALDWFDVIAAEHLRRNERDAHDHHPDHHLHRARAADQKRDPIDHVGDDHNVNDVLPSRLRHHGYVVMHCA